MSVGSEIMALVIDFLRTSDEARAPEGARLGTGVDILLEKAEGTGVVLADNAGVEFPENGVGAARGRFGMLGLENGPGEGRGEGLGETPPMEGLLPAEGGPKPGGG